MNAAILPRGLATLPRSSHWGWGGVKSTRASLAQLDRATGFYPAGSGFESSVTRQWPSSSTVELPAHNGLCAGSNPARATNPRAWVNARSLLGLGRAVGRIAARLFSPLFGSRCALSKRPSRADGVCYPKGCMSAQHGPERGANA